MNQRPGQVKALGLLELGVEWGDKGVPWRQSDSICLFTLHHFTSYHSSVSMCSKPGVCYPLESECWEGRPLKLPENALTSSSTLPEGPVTSTGANVRVTETAQAAGKCFPKCLPFLLLLIIQ